MTVEDEIRAVSLGWGRALVSNDAELVGTFMTDDWVYVGPSGATAKSDIIGWIASGRLAHHTMQVVGGERLTRVDSTVIFTARKASSGTWDGTPYTADEWISELYVPTDNGWQCAFSQKSNATG
jgi:ketosteroid isomerase-like protein